MTKDKNSLFDITSKTLDESQIASVITRFKEAVEEFTKLPQVELLDKSKDFKRLELRFVSLSGANNFEIPSIVLSEREICRNMETVRFIEIEAVNCGTCRGGSHAKFDNKNIRKLDQVLVNIQSLFEKNYNTALENDEEQVQFNEVIEEVRSLLSYSEAEEEKQRRHGTGTYTTTVKRIGSIEGNLYENRDKKDFRVELKHLTLDQIRELSKVIPNL